MIDAARDAGDDPVAEEIYRAKDEYARSLGYDLDRIVADLRRRAESRVCTARPSDWMGSNAPRVRRVSGTLVRSHERRGVANGL